MRSFGNSVSNTRENQAIEVLARDRRWVFALLAVPLMLEGETGSSVRPLALV
jgi:hypothetical protein